MNRTAVFQQAAAWALARDFAIFPLAERSKNPLAGSHGHADATMDPDRIADWALGLPYSNVGIRCGAYSRLFVLDVDVGKNDREGNPVDGLDTLTALELTHGNLPPTLTIRTGSGGLQFYFRFVEGLGNRASFGPGLDTRGEGGYVVAPGSIHPSGGVYTVENDCEIAEPPAWLIDLVKKPAIQPASPEQITPEAIAAIPLAQRESYVRTAVARETDQLASMPPESGRNDALNKAAFKLGTLIHFAPHLRPDMELALLDSCRRNGLATDGRRGVDKCNSTIKSGLDAGLSRPRPWPVSRTNAGAGAGFLPPSAFLSMALTGQPLAAAGADPQTAASGSQAPDTPAAPAPAAAPVWTDRRPVIQYQGAALDLPDIGRQAAAALVAQANTYSQSSVLSQLVPVSGWGYIARPYSTVSLMAEMARAAIWQTDKTTVDRAGKKTVTTAIVRPPDPAINYVLGTPPAMLRIPELAGITASPVMRADGSITAQPGYDPVSCMFYARVPSFSMADVPADPDRTDVAAAMDILDTMLIDFPFEDSASKANTISAMLSIVGRRLHEGSTPMYLITAPQQGTGKTLLAKGLILAATGISPSVLTMSEDRAELNKAITSELMSGGEAALFDNVTGSLENPDVAALITGGSWRSRILGSNQQVTIDVRKIFFVTGNNVRVGGDMVRRVVPISLDAQVSYAYKRAGWRHPDFLAYVKAERGQIVWALMTLLRFWDRSGRPAGGHTIGSFEPWAHMTGGTLALAGYEGYLGNLSAFEDSSDTETGQWETFLLAMHETFGSIPQSCGAIYDRFADPNRRMDEYLPDALQPFLNETSRGKFIRALGRAFMRINRKRHGASGVRVLAVANASKKTNEWSVLLDEKKEIHTTETDTSGDSIYSGR